MKKMKLYPKIFLYTFVVMFFITIIAHSFIYIFAPHMIMSTNHVIDNGAIIASTMNTSKLIETAILRAFPISLIFCTVTSSICSLLFSKVITKPMKEISKTTQLMASLNKSIQCPVKSLDEIGILATNINTLYHNLISTIDNLETEKRKVSQAEQSKINFLRAASHELKTPVTALNAILENMILGVGKYKNKDVYLYQCKDITTKLSNMIKEILDTSRMDFISESTQKDTFDLAEILLGFCEPYQLIAKSKNIDFQIDVQDKCPLCLSKKSLEKILSNLLSNAIQYTKEKHQISIVLKADRIMIENECTPISPDKLCHIFEPFYRPDFARDRKDGGNGLGLYIVDVVTKTIGLSYSFQAITNPDRMRFILYF